MADVLARRIYAAAHIEGDFLLRSGQRSSYYFDKYRFESDPVLLGDIADRLLALVPKDAEILAGLELGGVPIATAMSLRSGLPAAFVRKEAKTYGTCKAVEGGDVVGKRVVMVEDVISTGGAVVDAARLLHGDGAILVGIVCVIWRGQGEPRISALPDLPLRPLFTGADLLET